MNIITLLVLIPMIGFVILLHILVFFTLVLLATKVLDTMKQDEEDFRK